MLTIQLAQMPVDQVIQFDAALVAKVEHALPIEVRGGGIYALNLVLRTPPSLAHSGWLYSH